MTTEMVLTTCREKTHAAEAQLELKLPTIVVALKMQSSNNFDPLLDEYGCLTNRDRKSRDV